MTAMKIALTTSYAELTIALIPFHLVLTAAMIQCLPELQLLDFAIWVGLEMGIVMI